jgi:hypothetical protein
MNPGVLVRDMFLIDGEHILYIERDIDVDIWEDMIIETAMGL